MKFGSIQMVFRHKEKTCEAHIDEKGLIRFQHDDKKIKGRVRYENGVNKHTPGAAKRFLKTQGWRGL